MKELKTDPGDWLVFVWSVSVKSRKIFSSRLAGLIAGLVIYGFCYIMKA